MTHRVSLWREDLMILLAILLVVLAFGYVGKADMDSAIVTYQHVAEADERKVVRPCDGVWVRKCNAGECWSPRPPELQCVASADLTEWRARNDVLTLPVEPKWKKN
jgi:hypothetical protein